MLTFRSAQRACRAVLIVTSLQAASPIASIAQRNASPTVAVSPARKSDTSAPLGLLPAQSAPARVRLVPIKRFPQGRALSFLPDGAPQDTATVPIPVSVTANFAGLGIDLTPGPYQIGGIPPDTNGAVGETQFVQSVNSSVIVFDKKTHKVVLGPVDLSAVFSAATRAPVLNHGIPPGPCAAANSGDPVVQYDKIAKRWIISQFQEENKHSQCIAVSATSDAKGKYYRYEFNAPSFNDYPKLSVWPDAYYVTYNMFVDDSQEPIGARVCAYDRRKMLAGAPAKDVREVCFQLGTKYLGLLAADVDGTQLPAPGSPELLLARSSDGAGLDFWKLVVNWQNPAKSTLGLGPKHDPNMSIPVAGYTPACAEATCIQQHGDTQRLDPLSDRLMFRLAYRKFTDHESLVVTHAAQTSQSSSGIRWYELRDPFGHIRIHQQRTYAPDASARWIGSAAMDKFGDVAVGYSLSSADISPSIAITGQSAGAPADGSLAKELVVADGGGAESGTYRWGDYSAMVVDPVDDCTFWYTQEYLKQNVHYDANAQSITGGWSTRIVAFRFPRCAYGTKPALSRPSATKRGRRSH